MLPSLSALIFAAAGGLLVWRTNDGASDAPARLFVGLACAIAASGGVLSLFHELGSPIAWSLVGTAVIAVAWCLPSPEPIDPGGDASVAPHPEAIARFAVAVLGATAVTAAIANAVMIVGTAPGAWDALTYHLPRMALAVQNGA